jgi:hypothetical protein
MMHRSPTSFLPCDTQTANGLLDGRQEKDHSPSDLLRFQARQSRRQELLEMLQEVEAKLG